LSGNSSIGQTSEHDKSPRFSFAFMCLVHPDFGTPSLVSK
jgi:hypothetical protein